MEYFWRKKEFVEYFQTHGFWFGQKIWNVGPPIKSTAKIKVWIMKKYILCTQQIQYTTCPIYYTCNFVQKFKQTKWTTSTTPTEPNSGQWRTHRRQHLRIGKNPNFPRPNPLLRFRCIFQNPGMSISQNKILFINLSRFIYFLIGKSPTPLIRSGC